MPHVRLSAVQPCYARLPAALTENLIHELGEPWQLVLERKSKKHFDIKAQSLGERRDFIERKFGVAIQDHQERVWMAKANFRAYFLEILLAIMYFANHRRIG